jgi:hypothetical protein
VINFPGSHNPGGSPVPDFLDFLDPVAADAYRRQSLARQQAQDPTNPGTGLSPEEEESFLSHALDQSLGGLAYVGKVLDKPRRAVGAGLNLLAGGTPARPSSCPSSPARTPWGSPMRRTRFRGPTFSRTSAS